MKVWLNRHVSPRTKVKVYKAFVITSLLYGCQSWCTYKRHIKKLEAFHQKCLRRILGIKWQQHVTNNFILERAGIAKIETMISSLMCKWLGHFGRMDDTRLPKLVLFGKLKKGKRKQCKLNNRSKDCIRRDLKELGIEEECWYNDCQNRCYWRSVVSMGAEEFNERLISLTERKRRIRHECQLQRMGARCVGTTGISEVFRCSQSGCGRSFASRRGLSQHLRLAHGNAVVSMVTCPECGKSCSANGISRHKCSGK